MSLGLLVMLALILPKRSNSRSALWHKTHRSSERSTSRVCSGSNRIPFDPTSSCKKATNSTPSRSDRSLKSLFATGLFSDVTIRQVGETLVVHVVENPIINRVAFEGNQRIEDKTLESGEPAAARHLRAARRSDVQRILTLYRQSGRFAATVEPKVIELPQNRVDVVFEINEGPVTAIESIRFVGNKSFSDSRPARSSAPSKLAGGDFCRPMTPMIQTGWRWIANSCDGSTYRRDMWISACSPQSPS